MKTICQQTPADWLTRYAIAAVVWAAVLSAASVSLASGHGPAAEHVEHEAAAAYDANSRGIGLGEYQIRSYYPVQAQKSIVQFRIHATAPDERLAEMRGLAEQRKHKIRDQVITVSRLIPLAHFHEPDLKSFRRRVLLRLRRALPELMIDDIYVSDFQLKVQSL